MRSDMYTRTKQGGKVHKHSLKIHIRNYADNQC